jgi:steroid delta-isomerase-like uncharacterized protein
MLDIIKKHIADFGSANWNDYKAACAPDVVYEEMATNTRVKGADEYVKAVQKWKHAFPDAKGNITRSTTSGDQVVVEIQWEGTQSGPLEGPMGAIPPTNKRVRINAVMVTTVKNGKITEGRHFFDMLTILSQLGVAPMAGTGMPQSGKGDGQPAQRRP